MESSLELYYEARQTMDAGNLEDAVKLFEQSISITPHFKSLELLGECLINLNRSAEAIIHLESAIQLNKGV